MREEFEKLSEEKRIQPKHIDALVQLTEYGYCVHRGFGFGKINKLDTIESRFHIDFEDRPDHSMDLDFGASTLQPIHPDHILVRKATLSRIRKATRKLENELGREPDVAELADALGKTDQEAAIMKQDSQSLIKMAALDHIQLIRLVIRSFGGEASPSQIQEVLVPDVIETADWRRWWESVRKELKKDGYFRIPIKKTEPIQLNEQPESIDDRLLGELREARGLKKKIPIAMEMSKSHEDFVDRDETFRKAVDLLNEEIERLRGKEDARAIEGNFVRDDLLRLAGMEAPQVDLQSRAIWMTEEQQKLERLRQQFIRSRIEERDRIENELTQCSRALDAGREELKEAEEAEEIERLKAKIASTESRAEDLQQRFNGLETESYEAIAGAREEVGRLEWELEVADYIDRESARARLDACRGELERDREKLDKAREENRPNMVARHEKRVRLNTREIQELEGLVSTFTRLHQAREGLEGKLRTQWEEMERQRTVLAARAEEKQAEIKEARHREDTGLPALERDLSTIQDDLGPLQRIATAMDDFRESHRKSIELQETLKSAWKEKKKEELERILEKIPSIQPSDNWRIAGILEALPAARYKRALQSYRAARREDWTIAVLGIVNKVTARLVGECANLLIGNWDLDLFKKVLEQKINQHWASSDLLLWLAKSKADSFDDILGPEVFRAMIAALERDQISEKKSSRLYDHIMSDPTLLPRLIEKADLDTIKDLTRTLQLSSCFEDMDKRSLLARIVKSYPNMQSLISGETEARDRADMIVSPVSMDKRREEYENLVHKRIPANSKEIAVARSYGDLRENHEFKAAKEMQGLLMSRKAELEAELARAKITPFDDIGTEAVGIGTVVNVTDLSQDTEENYTILGAWDSDPDKGVISYLSPLAQALLNHGPGDEVVLEQSGNRKFRINRIERIPDSLIRDLSASDREEMPEEREKKVPAT